MEEEKAAAYYEELSRKGGGAARFKQGLGFSNEAEADPPSRRITSSSSSSSSSFMSKFVRASTSASASALSGNTVKEIEEERKTQIENIQNKLKKKRTSSSENANADSRVEDTRRRRGSSREERNRRSDDDSHSHSHSHRRSDEERDRSRRRRHRSPSKERTRDTDRRRRRRSRRTRSRSRSRSVSPRDRRRSHKGTDAAAAAKHGRVVNKDTLDYANLIPGYSNLTPAERVKAKMKLQLSQTAEKDTKMGSGLQWERFDFNKDAPVDDAEIEAADDDAALVKQIGKTFRFTSLEEKKDDDIKNAHDDAMFGVPAPNTSYTSESEDEKKIENENKETNDDDPANNLINEKVLQKQQGTWRDRARRNVG